MSLIFSHLVGTERQKVIDNILENKPKGPVMKPPSPKMDPRTGLPIDVSSALHIDHDTPVIPLQPTTAQPFNPGLADPLGLNGPPPPQPPHQFDQTPSEYSFNTNHSDQGYITTPGSVSLPPPPAAQYNSNNNHHHHHQRQNSDPRSRAGGGGFGGRNHGNFGTTPGSSSGFGSTPGSFSSTPMGFDGGVPRTPMAPQTPSMNDSHNDFDVNHVNRRRGHKGRERRDSYNNRERKDSYNNRENSYNNRDNKNAYNNRDKNRKETDWTRNRNSDWGRDRFGRDTRDGNSRDWRNNDREDLNDRDTRNNRYHEKERDRIPKPPKDYRNSGDRDIPLPGRNTAPEPAPVFPPPPPPDEEVLPPAVPMFTSPPKPPPLVIPPPVIPTEPVVTPVLPSPGVKEEEETRSMSLDSRIQSLLSGFKSPEPATPKTPPSAKQSVGLSPGNGMFDPNARAMMAPQAQDDDDRMSLDSEGSGGEPGAIEVHPANTSVPPPSLIPSDFPNSTAQVANWQKQNDLNNFNMPPGFGNNFNQNFVNQVNNEINNTKSKPIDPKEIADRNEVTFSDVLENFVKELKDIMTKDLCKKMVETSAFKCYESWWDEEEQKTKVHLISFF